MTTQYTDPFGGGTIRPSPVSFAALALTTATTELLWPGYATALTQSVVASKLDIESSVPSALLRMPDATVVSPGESTLITNLSVNSITVQTTTGVDIAAIAPGAARLIYLTSNATVAGTWRTIVYGVGTGTLDVSGAAGAGIVSISTRLALGIPAAALAADFTVTEDQRGRVLAWAGGVGTITVPVSTSLNTAYVFGVRNQGTGVVTIATSGSDTIDGSASVSLSVQESCLVVTDGAGKWYSVGRGRNAQFNFTLLSKAVTGGTVNLTQIEAANVVQRYTGVLVSNCSVVLPSVVQVYYVTNSTSGAFSVTFRTAGVGSTVSIPTGQSAILFCDGLNVINTTTTVSGISALILNPGSVSAPPIAFSGDTSTGIYRPVAGSVSIAGVATEIARFSGTASAVNFFTLTNATAGAAPAVAATGTDANISLALTPKGDGFLLTQVNNATTAARVRQDGAGSVQQWFAGAAQAMTLDAGGNLLLNAAAGVTGVGLSRVVVAGNSLLGTMQQFARFSADSGGSYVTFTKSRGVSYNTQGAVASSDEIGTLQYRGSDGANTQLVASAAVTVDGAVSAGIVPGRYTISTAGASGAQLERLRLDSAGGVLFPTDGATGLFQIFAGGAALFRASSNTTAPYFATFVKSRGTSSAMTTVLSGDSLATLQFLGRDGTGDRTAGSITVSADGVPATGTVPGSIVIATTPPGVSQTPIGRITVLSSGLVGIGTSPVDALNISDGAVNFQFKPTGGSNTGFFGTRSNHDLVLTTNDTERFRIGNTGAFSGPSLAFISTGITDGTLGGSSPLASWRIATTGGNLLALVNMAVPGRSGGTPSPDSDLEFYTRKNSISTSAVRRLTVKADGQLRFEPLAAAPGNAQAGDVYYNSTTNKHQGYNGTSWFDLY